MKKQKFPNKTNDLGDRISEEISHWLQNKVKLVLDDEGIILHDFVPIKNVFLDENGEI